VQDKKEGRGGDPDEVDWIPVSKARDGHPIGIVSKFRDRDQVSRGPGTPNRVSAVRGNDEQRDFLGQAHTASCMNGAEYAVINLLRAKYQ
jgi:hypothetical protein